MVAFLFSMLAGLMTWNAYAIPAKIVYVNLNATGSNTGTSWANAYSSLDTALYYMRQDPSTNYEVWIAKGTYHPVNKQSNFLTGQNTSLYGGFNGTETNVSQRNASANPTILSADLDDNDDQGIYTDNCESLLHPSGPGLLLDSLTLTGAVSSGHGQSGPAISSNAGAITLNNCRIVNNFVQNGNTAPAGFYGGYAGACWFSYIDVTMTNCYIGNNHTGTGAPTATSAGDGGVAGAFYLVGCNASFTNCTFEGNYAGSGAHATTGTVDGGKGGFGGAINAQDGALTLINCTFKNNHAGDGGNSIGAKGGWGGRGGAVQSSGSSLNIGGCKFINNRAGNSGVGATQSPDGERAGALYAAPLGKTALLYKCAFIGNTSGGGSHGGNGGGAYLFGDFQMHNCLFAKNKCGDGVNGPGQGGGVYFDGTTNPVFCTFADNSDSTQRYSGLYACNNMTLLNCIVWRNPMQKFGSATITPTYSCIENWTGGGTGNISTPPLFIDTTDYRLSAGSSCIDTGKMVVAFGSDREGETRGYDGDGKTGTGDGSETDIGCDEALIGAFKVEAIDASAAEPGTDQGSIRVTRTNPSLNDILLSFTWSGSATNGVDYTGTTSPTIFDNGSSSWTFPVVAKDDSISEGLEEAIFTLDLGNGKMYRLDSAGSASAKVSIYDNEPQGWLKVDLHPAEAVTAGAKWRPKGRSVWYASGTVVKNLAVGACPLEFLNVPKWIKPTKTPTIVASQQTDANATYTKAAVDASAWMAFR